MNITSSSVKKEITKSKLGAVTKFISSNTGLNKKNNKPQVEQTSLFNANQDKPINKSNFLNKFKIRYQT